MQATILPNGDLKITPSNRADFLDAILKKRDCQEEYFGRELSRKERKDREFDGDWHSDSMMADVFESFTCNSEYGWSQPYGGDLTDAPILAITEEDSEGEEVIVSRWWYPNYMIISPQEELLRNGYVVFDAA